MSISLLLSGTKAWQTLLQISDQQEICVSQANTGKKFNCKNVVCFITNQLFVMKEKAHSLPDNWD